MDIPAHSPARKFAARACERGQHELAALSFIAAHPKVLPQVPRWLRERGAATVVLRLPWWPYDAIEWVAAALPPHARVFEYGGGGSTLWLEDHGATVTVAEHDEAWHRELAGKLAPGTTLLFRPPSATGTVTSAAAPGYFDDYADAIGGERDGSLDLVIIDGRARVECTRGAMPKVKPGGLLLLDDTDRLRYRVAVDMLAGWERHVFTGLRVGSVPPGQTSAWRSPSHG